MAFYTVNGVPVYYAGAEGSPLISRTGGPVNIATIRKEYNFSRLYEDPDFPANSESLGEIGGDSAAESGKAAKSYEWRRPHEFCAELGIARPQFAVDQDQSLCGSNLCSEYDLKQGGLGDCWYVAALQALTTQQEQISFVVPEDNFNGFEPGQYCGAFHFRFYSMEHCKWVDVVVDDRLPAANSKRTDYKWAPAFTQISVPGQDPTVAEFWPALIEKAYAKFVGNYHFIEGGMMTYGLEDFTGGYSEIVGLAGNKDGLAYEEHELRVKSTMRSGNFVGISTLDLDSAHKHGALEAYTDYKTHGVMHGYRFDETAGKVVHGHDDSVRGLGLCKSHAYTAMDAQEIRLKDGSGSRLLLKLRNPHARHEWFGPFGDKDDAGWATLEKDLRGRNAAASTDIEDGVFWIDLHDVVKYCRSLNYCVFGLTDGTNFAWVRGTWPASLQPLELPRHKEVAADLHRYPAYKFEVKQELDDLRQRSGPDQGDKCMAAFQLILGGYHSKMNPDPTFYFYLYRLDVDADLGGRRPLQEFYKKVGPVFMSELNFSRDCNKWTFLEPGRYIIVPVLRTKLRKNGKPVIPPEFVGKDIHFAIRLFTENETKLELVTEVEF